MARALMGDLTVYTGHARSEIYRWFTDPRQRKAYPEHDHDRQSRAMVANLRAAYGQLGPKSRAGELAAVLCRKAPSSPSCGNGRRSRSGSSTTRSDPPELGPIEIDCQACSRRTSRRRCWC